MARRTILILAAAAVLVLGGATALVAYDQAEGRQDAAEFLQLDCGSAEWTSVTTELDESEPSSFKTEEEALLGQWDRLFPRELPEGIGVVSSGDEDGFLASGTGEGRTEFTLILDGAARARATVVSVRARGFVVEGLTKC